MLLFCVKCPEPAFAGNAALYKNALLLLLFFVVVVVVVVVVTYI